MWTSLDIDSYCYTNLYNYRSWTSLYSVCLHQLHQSFSVLQKLLLFFTSHLFSRMVSQWAARGRAVGRLSQLMHRSEVINVILRPNVPHRCRHWPAKTNNTYVPWGSSRDSLEKVKPDMKSVKRKVFVFTPEELWKLTQKFTFTILVLF